MGLLLGPAPAEVSGDPGPHPSCSPALREAFLEIGCHEAAY